MNFITFYYLTHFTVGAQNLPHPHPKKMIILESYTRSPIYTSRIDGNKNTWSRWKQFDM